MGQLHQREEDPWRPNKAPHLPRARWVGAPNSRKQSIQNLYLISKMQKLQKIIYSFPIMKFKPQLNSPLLTLLEIHSPPEGWKFYIPSEWVLAFQVSNNRVKGWKFNLIVHPRNNLLWESRFVVHIWYFFRKCDKEPSMTWMKGSGSELNFPATLERT